MRAAATLLAVGLLSILAILHPAQADTSMQDPMYAQATSFGWLAIRNFTYCMSSQPDPPNKPLGIQPKKEAYTSLSAAAIASKVRTGTGDSVVVLYHPDTTNKAIAWCNTLVAFQSTEHVNCHIALPTCQRCDAVRSKAGQSAQDPGGGTGRDGKAPSGKLGQPGTRGAEAGLVRRGVGGVDPNDPWVGLPGTQPQPHSEPQPQLQPQTGMQSSNTTRKRTSPRPFGTSTTIDADALNDPELQAAIFEFQDYCENRLTLAVRADCPLHIVKSWTDEPPFDLHRFCMSLRGSDGSTLHTANDPESDASGLGDTGGGAKQDQGGKPAASGGGGSVQGKGDGSNANSGGAKGDASGGHPKGVVDPDDPIVPFPFGGAPANASPPPPSPPSAPPQQQSP